MRPEARQDILEAAAWYAQQQPNLGAEFSEAVEAVIDSLAVNPLLYALRHRRKRVRWLLTKRFPYRVVYRVEADMVVVGAVLHAKRHDSVWRQRL